MLYGYRHDVYFGPKPPKGRENDWVPTNPEKGLFLVFRFYGPLEGIMDKSWKLDDLEKQFKVHPPD